MLGLKYKEALSSALSGNTSVWHYATDLSALWSDTFDPGQRIVIVWDRAPLANSDDRDDRLLEPHLTPLDWALSWSIKCANEGKDLPSIVIVDARVDQWAGSWAWTVRRQLLADMPWVTLTAPVVRKDGASALHNWTMTLQRLEGIENTDGVIQFADNEWGIDTDWAPRQATPEEEAALRRLNHNWTASLSQSDEHHDVNNIVGARILLARAEQDHEGTGEEGDPAKCDVSSSETVSAFLQKVAWQKNCNADVSQWRAWSSAKFHNSYLFDKTLYLTIYDDMYQSGWDSFLLHFLQELSCDAAGEDGPRELVEFIATRAIFDKRDFYQNAHEGSNGYPELIFLDFRLYPRAAREKFLEDTKALLEVAEQIVACPTLAWDEISQDEISGIKNWLERGANESEHWHEQALLLLPRLLALALPLTPIILFSSTAQARIRDQLKAYRNIFTGFQKPNPLGDPSSVETAVSALGSALDRAMPMLRRRLQLCYAQTMAEQMERERPERHPVAHFEIYFDESGGGKYRNKSGKTFRAPLFSSGAVIKFDNIEQADEICRKLTENALNTRQSLILEKSENLTSINIDNEKQKLFASGLNPGVHHIDIFSIKCRDFHGNKKKKTLTNFPDKILDDAISHNIYFLLFVYIEFFSHNNSTVAINLPTRRYNLGDQAQLAAFFKEKFSLEVRYDKRDDKYLLITYNEMSAFPLVRGWLSSWGLKFHEISERIISILAKSISGDQMSAQSRGWGRSLHYLADWAAGFIAAGGNLDARNSVDNLRPGLIDAIFRNVFYSDISKCNVERLSDCLRTCVSSEQVEMGRAISTLCGTPLLVSHNPWDEQLASVGGLSIPQENLWLWAIFPHIEKGANGQDLFCGL